MSEAAYLRNQIVRDYLKQRTRNELCAVGTGGGIKDNKVKLLSITFGIDKPMSVEYARKLIMTEIDQLLTMVNTQPHLQPHLIESPLTPIYVDIKIVMKSLDDTEEVCTVFTRNDKLYYFSCKNKKLMDLYEETFEEAEKILTETKNQCG